MYFNIWVINKVKDLKINVFKLGKTTRIGNWATVLSGFISTFILVIKPIIHIKTQLTNLLD